MPSHSTPPPGWTSVNMAAKVDKLVVNDPRATKQSTAVNGRRWHYIDAHPKTPPKGTIVLIHGFPDISFAWRYQIPLFLDLGFRCIALDCMGYSDTGTSSDLKDFSFKTHADAIAGIAKAIGVRTIVIGGHDWGGFTVYRVAQWYPDLVSHVFSVCTAYAPPMDKYISTEELSQTTLPQFAYQLQFGSQDGKVEKYVKDEASIRKFLIGMYGGKTASRKQFMTPERGIDLDMINNETISMTPLLSEEELDFYVKEFAKNGLSGPCSWYRTRKINWEDDLSLPPSNKKQMKQPTLYILATKDNVLTREMSRGMERAIPNLTRGEVPAGHWALWQTPTQVNAILKDWLQGVVLGGKSKL